MKASSSRLVSIIMDQTREYAASTNKVKKIKYRKLSPRGVDLGPATVRHDDPLAQLTHAGTRIARDIETSPLSLAASRR